MTGLCTEPGSQKRSEPSPFFPKLCPVLPPCLKLIHPPPALLSKESPGGDGEVTSLFTCTVWGHLDWQFVATLGEGLV